MGTFIDISGKKFGRLTAISPVIINKKTFWRCACDCGGTATVESYKLRHGETRSCGCIVREGVKPRKSESQKRLRRIWVGMKNRCYHAQCKEYKYYGQRGIAIDPVWLNDFEAFYQWAMYNGYDNNLTIDRIDPNGNYEPQNCRWLSIQDQQRNRRNNVRLTVGHTTHTMSEWSRILGVKIGTVWFRYKSGWTDEECLYGKAKSEGTIAV